GAVEVVLQGDGRRQVLGLTDLAHALDRDVVLERQGAQHLDAAVVADEVFERDARPGVAVDAQRQGATGQGAVVRLRVDLVQAEAQGPVAGGLGEGRGRDGGQGGGEQGEKPVFHR